MRELWNNFVKDESGQGLVEYVLIIGLIAIAIMAALFAFRGQIQTAFENWGQEIEDAPTFDPGG
jgi:pilus assembly protein Flp/PilA